MEDMNRILNALKKLNLSNFMVYEVNSNGETLKQFSGKLPSGEPIHVMLSNEGWHVGFGEMSPHGAPPAVGVDEAVRKILSA